MIRHSTDQTIKKKAALLCLLALGASCLAAGCGKDKHEKIDLASSHTAAETMAPETSKAPETTAGTTAALSLDAAVENAANANSNKTATDGSGRAPAVTGLKTTVNTYTSGKVSVQYPSVALDGSAKEASINSLLKENALSVIQANGIDEAADSLDIQCKVLSADRDRITVTYTGTMAAAKAAYPVNIFYSNTIDVGKVSNLGFSHYADPSAMAGYMLSDRCLFPFAAPELQTELMKAKNGQSLEYYTKLFNGADFPINGQFPPCFSYEQEGDIYFSVPVPHALGDYAIVVYTPDNK